jgi:hypothetical protein
MKPHSLSAFSLALLLILPLGAAAQSTTKLALSLPGPPRLPAVSNSAILALIAKNKKYPTTKAWRTLAEYYVKINRPSDAAAAYRAEAALHRRMGSNEAATKVGLMAARYETEIKLFLERPATTAEIQKSYTKAPLEPAVGAYLGAYIDYDDRLKTTWQDENWRTHRNPEEFTPFVQRPHATYFMYMGYGSEFPYKWLQKCKEAGAIAHIALEPDDLDKVQNDSYLQTFAKECGRLQWPIFLRYASEMNGTWTKWHGEPKKYREKFRLVHDVMKKYAPLVATVWCPNAVPLNNIMDYYPGDDAVDWVGVNVYSVPFYDNDPRNSAVLDSPLALIDPLYKAFADRKPMAICEYGASQMAAADKVHRPDFAITKMRQLYAALPRLYPRIKMISWFDMNTLKHAAPGRQLNDYSITEYPSVLDAYRTATASPYYISAGDIHQQLADNMTRAFPRPVTAGQAVTVNPARFSIWVKAPTARPRVYFKIGNKIVYAGQTAGAHLAVVNTKAVPSGAQPVTIYVYDELNRFIASRTLTLNFGKMRGDEPLHVAGEVLHYFGDASGYVTAMQIENSGTPETVYFAPTLAAELTSDYPEGLPVDVWVKPYVEKGAGVYKLIGLGEDKPEVWLPAPDEASTSEDGKIAMKSAPQELSTSLLMQSSEVRMAGEQGLVLYAPKLAKERGGEDVPIPKLMRDDVRPW